MTTGTHALHRKPAGLWLLFSAIVILCGSSDLLAQLSVTTVSLPPGTVASSYVVQLNATGGVTPYSWAIASGSLPAGLFLSGSTISGTPLAEGTSSFVVRVTDNSKPTAQTAQASLSIFINPGPISITTTSLPSASVGTAYNQSLAATGGTTPYTWSITAGSLPDGLKLTGAIINGVPTTSGVSSFTVRVTDSSTPPKVVQKDLTLTVVAQLLITTSSPLPNGTPGVSYSQTLTATGGTPTYRWSIDAGSLPPGITLSTAGTLAGTPTQAGVFTFTVRVTDSNVPPRSAVKDLALTIGQPLSIVTASLPAGIVTRGYSQTLTATGGTPPYRWTLAGGQLPPGLTVSTGGVIAGIPTTAGTFNSTIQVTDSAVPVTTTTRGFQLRIDDLLTITTTSLPSSSVGLAYSKQLDASVSGSLSWSVSSGSLPQGLALSGSGLISGTPTSAGSSSFTVRVTGGSPAQTAEQSFSISINPALTITTSATLPRGTAFTSYSVTLGASGGIPPYQWSVVSGVLPAGLALSSSGIIDGRPTESGNFTVNVQLKDSGGAVASRVFTIAIDQTSLRITTQPTLPSGFTGSAYLQKFDAAGGPPPYSWTLASGSLPGGLALTPDGTLQGIAPAAVSSSFRLRVVDGSGAVATSDFTLAIGSPLGSIALSGVQATTAPATQMPITLSLAAAYPYPVSGTLNMTFSSAAVVPADDPVTQFSTGGRSVAFTIPANTTIAVFPSSLMLLTGTVAGTINLTGVIQNGVSGLQFGSSTLPSLAPRITTVEGTRSGSSLNVLIAGYSTERRLTDITFSFDVRSTNGVIQHVDVSKAVEPEFRTWYQSPASVGFGSTFVFKQAFGVTGDATSIEAVTVTLRNGQGTVTSSRVAIVPN